VYYEYIFILHVDINWYITQYCLDDSSTW